MHYIYLLYDNKNPLRFFSYELHKLSRKIGSTCNVKTRMKPYLTGHPDKVPLECYYKILNPEKYSCYQIDEMIKNYFHEYNLKGNGGIEFYEEDKVTQEVLEKYFDLMGIQWEKLFEVIDEDIHTITKEDIQNISYDIENSKFYKKEEVKPYNLLNKYIDKIKERDIIKELMNENENVFSYLLEKYDDSLIINLNKIAPTIIDDQIEILLTTILYYRYYKNGILNLFCRYGKTMVSSLYCKIIPKYKKILVLVPSLYLVNQTYNTWIKYWSENIIKKVSCEEDLKNNDEILYFYNENDTCIFICTYHSSDKFEKLNFDICIYDEAHRTAGNKYDNKISTDSEDDKINIKTFKILLESTNIHNKLFLTATKKIYNGEQDDIYCMDDENIYGKTIASVSAIKARELKRICPYKIITIKTTLNKIDFDIEQFFHENKVVKEKQKKKLLELKDRYIMFAKGLIDCIKLHGIKHIITFHEYIINCKFFCKILEEINKQENLLTYVKYISGDDKKNIRDNLIDNFQTQNFSILCSAKVLQEGVDIPNCDGVIFIDNKTSNIDITQSFSRCLTYLDEKEAYIMIPYEDGTYLINDEKTNDLRLLLRNISEIDENIKEYFKEYNKINFENKTKEEKETEMKTLNIKYNISVELDFVNEMKEISYLPFKMAKDLIKGKYCDMYEYKNDINDFSKELPINPDEIYKRFGWNNWNDYLGQSNEMTLGKISKIIKSENENRKNKINKLTIRTAIKYTLLKFGQKTGKEIYEIICKEKLLPQLQGKTPCDSVTSHCYTMGNEGLIEKIGNNPIIFSFNGYNEFELIDSKEKYINFCKNKATDLPDNIEPENGNWIKFCLNNYDDLINNHYSIEELKNLNLTNIEHYISMTKIDSKLIPYEYICSGFYNISGHFNISSVMNPSEEYIE